MFLNGTKLPLSFDYEFYKKDKPFLLTKEEAYNHFITVGRQAGLKGSPACDQGYLLNYLRNLHPERMLEIGPGCVPKLKGDNVFYFDVKSKQELQERYKNDVSFHQIPDEIHYVDGEGNLGIINEKFDIVFSSHAIEHTLDLIDHLNDVQSLLNKNGLYVVVAPNKKYTFDYFKPISVIEDVLAQHFGSAQTSAYLLRAVLLETHRRTHNSSARHWANDHGEVRFDKQSILSSIARFDDIVSNDVAISGYHKWIFDDKAFTEIINELHKLELTSLRIYESYNTLFGSMSFSAIMGR